VRYLLLTTEVKPRSLHDFIVTIGSGTEEAFMTGAEQLTAQARAEERAKALEEGQAMLLLRQLGRRFGPLPPEAQKRVQNAGSAELEEWAERVLSAETLEEVLGR
jgi:hypothetical protein